MTRLRNPDRIAWTVLAMMAGCLVAASAQAAKPAPIAPVVQEVIDCRKLEDTTARLACYDKAVDGMAKADANGDLITVDRQQREALRHQAFGLSLPSLLIFERGAKSDDINRFPPAASRFDGRDPPRQPRQLLHEHRWSDRHPRPAGELRRSLGHD